MPYAFVLTDTSLQDALRRLAGREIRRALAHLSRDTELPPDAVHEIRKSIKKTRALLRLVKHGMEDVRQAENAVLRDAGQALAVQRDRAVRLATLDRLVGPEPAPAFADLRRMLAQEATAPVPTPPLDLRPTFAALLDRVQGWKLHGSDKRILAAGLAETHGRAQLMMQRARRNPDLDHIHDWRKRAKDHWYQARLFVPVWPDVMKPITAAADRLGEALGDHHDLGVLASHLATLPGSNPACTDLIARAREAQAAIEGTAFALGARLYAGDPDDMAALWLRWWKIWRAQVE